MSHIKTHFRYPELRPGLQKNPVLMWQLRLARRYLSFILLLEDKTNRKPGCLTGKDHVSGSSCLNLFVSNNENIKYCVVSGVFSKPNPGALIKRDNIFPVLLYYIKYYILQLILVFLI